MISDSWPANKFPQQKNSSLVWNFFQIIRLSRKIQTEKKRPWLSLIAAVYDCRPTQSD